jgi:hypothetical protein
MEKGPGETISAQDRIEPAAQLAFPNRYPFPANTWTPPVRLSLSPPATNRPAPLVIT